MSGPTGTGSWVVRPAGQARDALLEVLAAGEPGTTRALSDLRAAGTRGRGCRAWLVTDGAGRAAGAVVATRTCPDRWRASAHLLHPEAAPVVAGLVDRSPAWALSGPAASVEPLVPWLARRRLVSRLPWVVVHHPIRAVTAPPAGTRLAGPRDLDALVDLYAAYELGLEPTRWQLRSSLRRHLRGGTVVLAEHGGAVVGALVVAARTDRFLAIDDLTVLPEHRPRRVGWALIARAQALANDLGLSATMAVAPTNPMPLARRWRADDDWMSVALLAPAPFRGVGHLRRWSRRVQPLERRSAALVRDPSDPTRRPT